MSFSLSDVKVGDRIRWEANGSNRNATVTGIIRLEHHPDHGEVLHFYSSKYSAGGRSVACFSRAVAGYAITHHGRRKLRSKDRIEQLTSPSDSGQNTLTFD